MRVQIGHPVAIVRSLRFPQVVLNRPQLRIAVQDEFDRGRWQGRGFLRHRRDVPAGGQRTLPEIGVPLTAQNRKETGLAAAVCSHQANAPACVDLQVGILYEAACAAGKRKIAELNHLWETETPLLELRATALHHIGPFLDVGEHELTEGLGIAADGLRTVAFDTLAEFR